MKILIVGAELCECGRTDGQADRQRDRQADRETGRQTDRQTDRRTDRQTGGQTDTTKRIVAPRSLVLDQRAKTVA